MPAADRSSVGVAWRAVLPRRPPRTRAFAFVLGSCVVHAAAALVLPGFARDERATPPVRLTVTLATPTPASTTPASTAPASTVSMTATTAAPRSAPAPRPSETAQAVATSRPSTPQREVLARREVAPLPPPTTVHRHVETPPVAPTSPPADAPASQATTPAAPAAPTTSSDAPPAPSPIADVAAAPANATSPAATTIAAPAVRSSNETGARGTQPSSTHSGVAYLTNPPPDYPAVARRLRLEGTVLLRVLVGAGGAPEEVRLAATSGATVLDDAAIEAVRRWRFVAAQRGAEAIAHWTEVPVRFRLAEQRR
jgi:protein TonB